MITDAFCLAVLNRSSVAVSSGTASHASVSTRSMPVLIKSGSLLPRDTGFVSSTGGVLGGWRRSVLLGARVGRRGGIEEFAKHVEGDLLGLEQGLQKRVLEFATRLGYGGRQPTNRFFDALRMRNDNLVGFAVIIFEVTETQRVRPGEPTKKCASTEGKGKRAGWSRFSEFSKGDAEACKNELRVFGCDWRCL